MGNVIEVKINRFDGGLTEDKRVQDLTKYSVTKHFDAYTYPHKLVPYYKTVASNGTAGTAITILKIVKFLYAPYSSGYRLYGFGVVAASTKAQVFIFDIGGTLWDTPVNNVSSVGARDEKVFFYYKTFIYMWKAGTTLMAFDTAGGAWNDTYKSISYTNLAEPVHHPADDVAYFFSDNNVHTLNGASWTTNALVLPTNMVIVSACAYGNYLAIGCVEVGSFPCSIVYLWDRNSSLTTLTDRIDFGRGSLMHLANLNNKLIGVMDFYTSNAYVLQKGKFLVKQANGSFATTVNQIITDTIQVAPPTTKMVKDDKLYFPMKATLNGDSRLGIWVVDENGKIGLDFLEFSATSYDGIFSVANMWWIAHSANGSVTRTDDGATYDATNASIYESTIFTGGDSSLTKKLVYATVMFEPLLTSSSQVVLKYRKDSETSWTTIFTYTGINTISHSALKIEGGDVALPEHKEIQFRIESTLGAVITGLKFKQEILPKDISD